MGQNLLENAKKWFKCYIFCTFWPFMAWKIPIGQEWKLEWKIRHFWWLSNIIFFLVCWIWIISSSQEVHNSFVALRCKYTKKESFEEKMGILGSSPPHNNPTVEVMYKCRVDKRKLTLVEWTNMTSWLDFPRGWVHLEV